MDVLVLFGVAHQQVIAALVCVKNWFRWRELRRTSLFVHWFLKMYSKFLKRAQKLLFKGQIHS